MLFLSKMTPNDLQVSHPLSNDKYEVARLWQDVFHDSDEYIELFFNRVYKPENTFVIKRNGSIISELQMIPYHVKLNDKIIPAVYLCGLCTHPMERGRGFMKNLMRYAMIEMQRRGYSLVIVIPAEPSLFNYYRKQGFIYPINHTIEFQFIDIKAIDIFDSQYPYTFESCSKAHFTYFDRKQHALEKTILHDVYDFETILRELKIDQGEACVALNNSTPVGMVFAKKCSQDVILIKQIFSDNQTIHAALQKYACRLFETHHVKTILPATSTKEAIPYGLACIIDNQNHNLNNTCMSLMLD